MAAERSGLLLDWGGVMTTSLLESFSAFCTQEGIEPERVVTLFRRDREARSAARSTSSAGASTRACSSPAWPAR